MPAGRVNVESRAPLKVSGQRLPVRASPHLQSCRGTCCQSVYVRDSLLYSSFNSSRDYCSCRAAQIVARRLQARSSAFEKLDMELPGHVIPAPTADTIHSCSARVGGRSARLGCAGAPSDRGTGWKRTGRAIRSFNDGVLRPNFQMFLFELSCCAIPITVIWSGCNRSGTCKSGRWTRFGDACQESQLEMFSKVPGESVRFSSYGRFSTRSVVGSHCCMGREMHRSRRKMCAVPSLVRGRRAASAMLGSSAVLRKSSSPALHEARTLLGASAGISRSRPPVTPTRAVTPKYGTGRTQELTITGERVRSGYGSGNNGNEVYRGLRRRIRRDRAPAARRPRSGGTHSVHPPWIPGVIIPALLARVREDLTTLPRNLGAGSATQRSILFTTVVTSEACEGSS